jgi:hypothetical protein
MHYRNDLHEYNPYDKVLVVVIGLTSTDLLRRHDHLQALARQW